MSAGNTLRVQMDVNKLPRLFSKGTIALLPDDEEDSRGKAREGRRRGMGYEWNYRSLEGDVGARFAIGPVREGAGSLFLSLFLSFSTNGVIK